MVERDAGAIVGLAGDGFRDNDIRAADAGEAAVFGEAAELDGAVFGTFDFKDGARDFRVLDEGFVSGVEEDDGVVLLGIFHPCLELRAGGDGSGRVVGETEIDDICLFVRDVGDEMVFRVAREI